MPANVGRLQKMYSKYTCLCSSSHVLREQLVESGLSRLEHRHVLRRRASLGDALLEHLWQLAEAQRVGRELRIAPLRLHIQCSLSKTFG